MLLSYDPTTRLITLLSSTKFQRFQRFQRRAGGKQEARSPTQQGPTPTNANFSSRSSSRSRREEARRLVSAERLASWLAGERGASEPAAGAGPSGRRRYGVCRGRLLLGTRRLQSVVGDVYNSVRGDALCGTMDVGADR